MSPIQLRPVRAEDAPVLAKIVAEVFDEYGMALELEGWDQDLLAPHDHYTKPGFTFVVAEHEGTPIGMAGGHLEAHGAELHRLYINPRARGSGLGARLCEHIENWARAEGAVRIWLWSDIRLIHGHKLYRRRGYQVLRSRVLSDLDRSVELGMERQLHGPAMPAIDPLPFELRKQVRSLVVAKVCNAELLHKIQATLQFLSSAHLLDPRDWKLERLEATVTGKAGQEVVLGLKNKTGAILWHPSVCKP